MAPAYERAAAELEPDFRLLKVNTEEEQSLAARYGIRSIPTLLIFKNGKLVDQIIGAQPKQAIAALNGVLRRGWIHPSDTCRPSTTTETMPCTP